MTEYTMVTCVLFLRLHILMPSLHVIQYLVTNLFADILSHIVTTFITFNDDMEQLVDTLPGTTYSRNHRNPDQFTQLFIIQMITTCLQFIIHVQCNNHFYIHVDELGSKIEITFQVRSIHYINNKVGSFFDDMLANINFFRRIGRERISTRKVNNAEVIPLK